LHITDYYMLLAYVILSAAKNLSVQCRFFAALRMTCDGGMTGGGVLGVQRTVTGLAYAWSLGYTTYTLVEPTF